MKDVEHELYTIGQSNDELLTYFSFSTREGGSKHQAWVRAMRFRNMLFSGSTSPIDDQEYPDQELSSWNQAIIERIQEFPGDFTGAYVALLYGKRGDIMNAWAVVGIKPIPYSP